MNKSYTIDELISGYFESELKKTEDVPLPRFSLKHKIRMKQIFRQFEKSKKLLFERELSEEPSTEAVRKPLAFRNRILIAVLVIIFLAFVTTAFVVSFLSNGFKGVVYNDSTQLMAINAEGSPLEIEKEYALSVVPEGFELESVYSDETRVTTRYRNPMTNQWISFYQTVKSEYLVHINTEGFELQEIEINGCNSLCIDFTDDRETASMVIWENEDYILELSCDFPLEETIVLAEENEANGF